jgi:ArsR family transcriptional regulator, arsenate/arsenite/antimonite-responsive transcriptional repressor
MEKMKAITVMSALAQPTRLAVFSLLARAGEEGMTAGDLAERTGTPANTMSSHLTILSQAGLATSRRAGRNIFYRAVPEAIRQLAVFLIKDCCDGCAEVCGHLQDDLNACRRGPAAKKPGATG